MNAVINIIALHFEKSDEIFVPQVLHELVIVFGMFINILKSFTHYL